ncbi:TnsA-like heteromeric transposase endonuclease subunit [Streptomyces qinglanensis]|uniref:TnsA-like heteromeric transposase endonuclease subunit n=1 Tax=Streptomyces qinglanensis TaxID=943816 RepID=UPI003D71DE42
MAPPCFADCPSHPDAGGERALNAAEAVAEACAHLGWTYQRLAPLGDILAANLKWLAGYRHPRNAGRPGLMPAVLDAFAQPRPLLQGAETAGDPIEVLPALFHALWHRQLTTDLDTPSTSRSWSARPRAETAWTGREAAGERPAQRPAGAQGRGSRPLPRREVAGGRPGRAGHPPHRPGRRR